MPYAETAVPTFHVLVVVKSVFIPVVGVVFFKVCDVSAPLDAIVAVIFAKRAATAVEQSTLVLFGKEKVQTVLSY